MSEGRDAEDVRELLSTYFIEAATIVNRYGGIVEKFIGDAVMAVWGVPAAHEDDAERAVRAGLDLIASVNALGDRVGASGLNMRVGVLTGEVAVTLGAIGEGMVAGDAVNTAARIQSAAAPGQVWVDDRTRSLTAAAVSYADEGEHELKGKAEPLRLYSARPIVASDSGAQRVDGLEAPFLGRDRELRLVQELFHASIDEQRPRLVAISGLAGVGKSRLSWEFEKYIGEITERVRWHRGRILSYGEGVSFWALSEMVRARLGVTDGEPTESVDQKLTAGLEELVTETDERAWLRPRLATLLGLEMSQTFPREDLFGAWTAFFERVSRGRACVALVFDDMQYADAGLLDFLDYLLDAARFPLFVLTLARPELADARPAWGTGRRATALYLEPVSDSVMGEIVDGLVDGLPAASRATLVARAEGIPLYALETVRSLIDRDAVIPKDGRYVLADDAESRVDLATLDAPASLQALIAARLDALAPAERQAVQDATVHGLAFSRDGLAAVSAVQDLDAVLAELVRKEILALHEDRFSPERGQYRFVQALVRTVAYDTLARRDRKARHLAVAEYLQSTTSGDELAAVIAQHYLDAIDSGRSDSDVAELEERAVGLLERAGRRAESLGSPEEALRHYMAAVARNPEPIASARLVEGMARAAHSSRRLGDALGYGEQARAAYESLGRRWDAARVVALLGNTLTTRGEMHAAIELMTPVYEQLDEAPEGAEAVLALADHLARAHSIASHFREAAVYADRALQLADATQDLERVVGLLNRFAVIWFQDSKPTGAMALLRAAVELGRDKQLPHALIIPLINTTCFGKNRHLPTAVEAGREANQLMAQVGARDLAGGVIGNLASALWVAGEWDEAEALYAEHQAELAIAGPYDETAPRTVVNLIRHARGGRIDPIVEFVPENDPLSELWVGIARSLEAISAGDGFEASRLLTAATDVAYVAAQIDDDFTIGWPMAVEQALVVGEIAEAERMLAMVGDAPPGLINPLAHAHLLRLRALVNRAKGAQAALVDADLEPAIEELRDFGAPFYLAKALLERGSRESLDEACDIFTGLGATPWVEQARTAILVDS